MLPDYFQSKMWGDSIVRVSAEWLTKKLKVKKTDHKLQDALAYHPYRLPDEATRPNFSATTYAYFAEIQTELTLGYNKKNLPELDKGQFILYLRVFDQKQRKVMQESLRIPFAIQPCATNDCDVWLTEAQFKELYHKALRILFQKEAHDKKTGQFTQGNSPEVTQFLTKATKTILTHESRGQYLWARGDSVASLTVELQMPHYEDRTHRREATFVKAGKERIQMKGLLSEQKPTEFFIQFAEPQINLAGIQNAEVLDLAETISQRNAWTWLAYQHNGLVKVYEGDDLKAILLKNAGAGFEAYLAPHCKKRDVVMIEKLLAGEVLVKALQKQYEMR